MMKPMNAMQTEPTLTAPTLAEPTHLIRPQTLRKSVTAVLGVSIMLGGVVAMSVDLNQQGLGTETLHEWHVDDAISVQNPPNSQNPTGYDRQWSSLGAETYEGKESLAFKKDDYPYVLNETGDPAATAELIDVGTVAKNTGQKSSNQAPMADERVEHLSNKRLTRQVTYRQSYSFESGQVTLNPAKQEALRLWLMQKVPKEEGVRIRISGYADTRGSAQGNWLLSEKRADNVKAWIQSQWKTWGWKTAPVIISAGLGQTNQFSAENANENRRVELSVQPLAYVRRASGDSKNKAP